MHALCIMLLTFFTACRSEQAPSTSSNATSNMPHDHSKHEHGLLEVTSLAPDTAVPSVNFSISADSMSGWNIRIDTENFNFTPDKIDQPVDEVAGHAHIFVDDFKMARVYGNWYHLRRLTPGEHTVRITLNANDHSEWSHQGKPIAAEQRIIQPHKR